jgi:uncharacterized protein
LKDAAMPPEDELPQIFVDEQQFMPPAIEPAETSRTVIAGNADDPAAGKVLEFNRFEETESHPYFSAFSKALAASLRLFFQNGGKHAIVLGLTDLANANGLDALADHEFNLFCIPTALNDPDVAPELHAAAYDLCVEKRAVYLVDPPVSWSSASDPVRAAVDGARRLFAEGKNAALYFPRVNLEDGAAQGFSPSGAIAGFICRNDAARGVWKAPAGEAAALMGVAALAAPPRRNEREALNAAGINSLMQSSGQAPVIWGGRTLAGRDGAASDWKYLPVRRLALFIETSVARGLSFTVFERNDERLWAIVRDSAVRFLQGLFRQGAFQGQAPREAYFVRCDQTTTVPEDIINGRLVCEIGFAPLKPAEFVILRISAKTAG